MKSIIRSMLVAFLVLCMSITVFGAINTNADIWAVSSMEKAYVMGVLPEPMLKRAKDPITRKEFCSIAVRFYESVTKKKAVPTLPSRFLDEASADVAFASEKGIISGTNATKFSPSGSLTREQMAIIIVKTLKACDIDLSKFSEKNGFSDSGSFSSGGLEPANQLYNAKVVSGYQKRYDPQKEVSVQEAVVAFLNAFEKLVLNTSYSETIELDGKRIRIGESVKELKKDWGKPSRIDKNQFDLDRYVYLGDYKDFFMVSIKDGKIVEFFTNSDAFCYQGVLGTGALKDIKEIHYLDKSRNRAEWKDDKVFAAFSLDNERKIQGLLVQKKDWDSGLKKGYDKNFQDSMSLEVFDLVNAYRVKNGKLPLTMDLVARKVAENHSLDMSKNSFVGYNNTEGETPFQRMSAGGIKFSMAAENVAKSDEDAISIYNEWVGAMGTKKNLLNGTLTQVGIGVYIENYTAYITADFYCP